jgi:phosphopantothenoylcysteine decarboxylase/phosphopantothenate--cysteine ligase
MHDPDILQAKRVAVYVSGSVAAYKTAEVVTQLRKAGAEVRVAMTSGALHFVTPTTFRALSGNPVATSLWDSDTPSEMVAADVDQRHGMTHLSLSQWAEVQVAVPASANLITRIVHGFADDPVTAGILASHAPLIIAPAMETAMWEKPVTQSNVAQLRERGAQFVGPERGRLASGKQGSGRMAEPDAVVAALRRVLSDLDVRIDDDTFDHLGAWLAGKRVVITAGGTREAIDPVRFIGNRCSGMLGNALAVEAARLGARVTLITTVAPPSSSLPIGVVEVETADEMHAAVREAITSAYVLIMAAAVADERPAEVSRAKMKKAGSTGRLDLVPTVDILTALRDDPMRSGKLIVGFAAETDDLINNAKAKLVAKGLDLIVANLVGDGAGIGTDDSAATLIGRDGFIAHIGQSPKPVVAAAILQALRQLQPAT